MYCCGCCRFSWCRGRTQRCRIPWSLQHLTSGRRRLLQETWQVSRDWRADSGSWTDAPLPKTSLPGPETNEKREVEHLRSTGGGRPLSETVLGLPVLLVNSREAEQKGQGRHSCNESFVLSQQQPWTKELFLPQNPTWLHAFSSWVQSFGGVCVCVGGRQTNHVGTVPGVSLKSTVFAMCSAHK